MLHKFAILVVLLTVFFPSRIILSTRNTRFIFNIVETLTITLLIIFTCIKYTIKYTKCSKKVGAYERQDTNFSQASALSMNF